MGIGADGYLAISKQNSFGTATTSYFYIEILNESFTTNEEQLILEGLHGDFSEGATVEGIETIEGDLTMNMHPLRMGHFLQAVCGQATSTNLTSVTGFQDYTHEFIPRQADFDDNISLPPYTTQVFRDTGEAYQYTDTSFPSLTLDIEGNAVPQLTISALSRTTSLMTATGPSFETATPFAWNVVSISFGGVGLDNFENVSISFEQGLEAVTLLNATKRSAMFMRNAFQAPKVSGTFNFAANSEYLRFKAQTEERMLITFGSMVTSGATFQVDLPKVRYTSFAGNLDGPGRISADIEGDCKFDTNSSYAIRYVLVNTAVSY